ncbi:MAG: rubrerythrin family protein [Clostridiales bacterium]|nr:rubrerythrin family protein [Clostridiales bacterium]
MNSLRGSQTEKNLRDAFSGESEARNKYTYFASIAKKDGFEQISSVFQKTADNEKEHAKIWFKLLNGLDNTEKNLESAANGEHFEHSKMYPEFAKIAKEEGFYEISELFSKVAEIEKEHEDRYRKFLNELKKNEIFFKKKESKWICRNCGHIHFGKEAPKECSVCNHPRSFFELFE